MRCLVTLVLVLSPSFAAADMISPIAECPAGQMSVSSGGCGGGHGSVSTCAPARCADDASCGEGNRCVQVARCFEPVTLNCSSGDGRNPDSIRTYTVQSEEERGECGAGDACPDRARCRRFGECQPAPPEPSPVAPAAVRPEPVPPVSAERAPEGTCTIGRARVTPSLAVVLLAVAALSAARRIDRVRTRGRDRHLVEHRAPATGPGAWPRQR